MSIKKIYVNTSNGLFSKLEELSKGPVIFRGHRDGNKWRVGSTLSRHRRAPYNPGTSWEIDEMLRHFLANIKLTQRDFPFAEDSRRGRLEFGRHYGIPSPLVDFSRSPYVATFFAFSGVRPYESKAKDKSAICCVNVFELASVWARMQARQRDGKIDSAKFTKRHNEFMSETSNLFDSDYPLGVLQYIGEPASWNRRMRRQLGRFLYDSLNYSLHGLKDLEDFMAQAEVPGIGGTILTKVFVPHKIGKEVLERLDLMGISATHLYDDYEGAAIDVINEYNYDRKSGRVWDLQPPPAPTA